MNELKFLNRFRIFSPIFNNVGIFLFLTLLNWVVWHQQKLYHYILLQCFYDEVENFFWCSGSIYTYKLSLFFKMLYNLHGVGIKNIKSSIYCFFSIIISNNEFPTTNITNSINFRLNGNYIEYGTTLTTCSSRNYSLYG